MLSLLLSSPLRPLRCFSQFIPIPSQNPFSQFKRSMHKHPHLVRIPVKMAGVYRCQTNRTLINRMNGSKIISSYKVLRAMAKTDRGKFVVNPRYGYKDLPQKLGYGATMSGPQMHAFTASTLLPYLTPGSRVLDVGSGSGYLTAVFHHLVGREGLVVGIDHVPELIERSKRILEEIGLERELRYGRILFVNGDGRDGYPEGGPYDVIHVGAASPVPPPKLIQQLASPGKMFIPIGGEYQNIVIISKDENGRVGTEIIVPFIEPLSPAKFDLLRDLDKQLEEGEKKEKEKEKEKEGFGRREVLKMRSHS